MTSSFPFVVFKGNIFERTIYPVIPTVIAFKLAPPAQKTKKAQCNYLAEI